VTSAIQLTPVDLLVASALVAIAGALSVALKLGLLPKLLVASVRTVVQLVLLGQVLSWVFDLDSAPLVLGLMGLMGIAAGHAAVGRSSRRFRGVLPGAIATLVVTGTATTFAVTAIIIGVDPWYEPQYVIPLLGMILGNTLTGISLSLDGLLESLDLRRDVVEMELAHGATAWEAARAPVTEAVRRGMIPILNAMSVVGIVSLPGMMTGQILQGADPVDAIAYQIVVMFMLAAASALGSIGIALLTFRRLFTTGHALRAERILPRASGKKSR
jgi:putative ABC transport system permease protein